MQRYFCDSNEEVVTLSSDYSYHITKVMRMNVGDNIELVSNNKLYIAEIIKTTPNVMVKKNFIQESFGTNINIDIAQSIVVEQKMDYILQKGTELGANKFIPLIVDRSVVKLNDKSDKIKIGDIINFSVLNDEMLTVKVIVIDKIDFDDLDELWNNKDLLESNLSFANKEEFVNAFHNIFGEEKVIASKIVGIKFNVID